MKTKIFEVSIGILSPFFEVLSRLGLHAELLEVNNDQELVVKIRYTDDDKEEMMNLVEVFDDLREDEENEKETDEGNVEEEYEEEEEEPEVKPKRKATKKSSRK